MKIVLLGALILSFVFLSGCQMGYLVKQSYGQLALLSHTERIEYALKDPNIDKETKRKILLVQEVKKFAEEKIGLVHTRNYDKFIKLDDPYVTYVVSASPKNELKAYLWSFPFVGSVPYKGFFHKEDAKEEKEKLEKEGLDASMRGVSAYSTLGWLPDPLLSSMTSYDDPGLVDTIIHETTHATIYIKSNADFNERLAMFVGNKGMEEFYIAKEGASAPEIQRSHLLSEDSKIFAAFISQELKDLEEFYKKNKDSTTLLEDRQKAFDKIKKNFTLTCEPKLKTDSYKYFSKLSLNNAVLLGYKTYYQDLEIFSKAFTKLGSWPKFFEYFKSLKKSDDPEKDLRAFVSS
jgi:predicted aminopeptidase